METGYVLFNLKPGTKKDFLEKMRNIRAIKEVRLVIGNFDAIAKIETESIDELEKIYLNEIERITNITNARLHFVACPRTRK